MPATAVRRIHIVLTATGLLLCRHAAAATVTVSSPGGNIAASRAK